MSNHIRPGVRGGRDQFSWEQVKEDKQRLNYLGSSIHGVPDKFKKGPETFWYAKETKSIPESKSNDKTEIDAIKDKEKQIMEVLLGGGTKPEKKHRNVQEPIRIQQDHRGTERLNPRRDYDRRDTKRNNNEYSRNPDKIYTRISCRSRSRSPDRHRNRSPDRRNNRSPDRYRYRSRSPKRMYK